MDRMASSEATFLKIQMNEKGIRAVLPTLVCEWVLIVLLFIDASLSYLVTKFAHYCQLPAPCLLCSRIDHVLDGDEPDIYWSLLCSNHRSEVSSLISCQLHDKLADGYKMCEECLLSFTAKNKQNPEMHRFMAGKLGQEHGCGFQGQSGGREFMSGFVNTRSCSCCSKPWRSRHGSQRLFPQKAPPGVSKPNLPRSSRSPRSPESTRKTRNKHSVPSNPFGKMKMGSGSGSGSDSESNKSIVPEKSELKKNIAAPCDSEDKPPLLDTFEKININDSIVVKKPSIPNVSVAHGLGDQDHQKANPYDASDGSPSPSRSAFPYTASASTELVSLPNTPPSVGPSPKKSENASGIAKIRHVSTLKHEEPKGSMPLSARFAIDEDTELFSSPLGTHLPLNNTSPYRTPMSPNSHFEERLEESYSDCLDTSTFHETEGGDVNVVAKLKQQIRDHQKRINELYKELDAERNASNIAANEAMAMIRRLQEEKSALHMEASQYLRMMEEQAEHDADDLERTSDLLADRERDIQDLEAEIEFYRSNFPEEQLLGNEPSDVTMKSTSLSHARNNLVWIALCRGKNDYAFELSWLEFKDDKLYISQGLEILQSKLQENEACLSNTRPSNSSSSDLVVALENEISDLKNRLKTLEANQDFLERALISLQKGNEGIHVVLEIARQLQALWNIGIRIRSDPVL